MTSIFANRRVPIEPGTNGEVYSDAAALLAGLRVAIVHHWFLEPWCGAEMVVEAIARVFPQADLFAMICDPDVLPPDLKRRRITTSFLQRIPGKVRLHRQLMPLYPLALEQFDLGVYDLVISSESAPAKGVITATNTCHICYCHSPMRYIWDMYHDYKSHMSPLARGVFALVSHYARIWDLATASRVDYFIANSQNVADRIRKHYRRDATVIHAPINVSEGFISEDIEDYYLILGRLVPYKRVDLAIEACNRLGRRLKVIGDGPQMDMLRKIAGPTIELLGFVPRDRVRHEYAHCRALLFPGEEDFGLVPLEAQSFGRPVIAYGRGGALETIRGLFSPEGFVPEATGVFFREQSADSMLEAIQYFESMEGRFVPKAIRARAAEFDEDGFRAELTDFIVRTVDQFRQKDHGTLAVGVPN